MEETLKRVRKGGYIAGEGATEFGDTEYTHRHLMGYDSEPSSGVKTLVYGYLYPENFMGRGPTMWERGVGNTTMREYGPIRLSFDSTVLRTDGVTVSYGDYGMLNNWKEDYTPRTICLPYTSTSPRVRTLIASVRHLMYDFQTGMSNKRGWGEDPNESNVIGKFRNTSANNTPYGTDYIEVHYPGGEIAPEHIETVFNVATERPVD